MSVNSAKPPAQAQGKEIVEPALSYGEMSELVWRLRVENEELRKGQSSQEDVAAKVHAAESSLRAEMDALRAELTEEQSRTASIEADNRELFAENNRLQDRLHALDNEAAKERRLRQRLEGELRSMTSRAEDLEAELDALRSKRDQIASKLADTERMLAGEQRENELMLRAAAEAEFKKRLKEVEDWKTRQAFRRPRPKNAGSSATARSRFPQQKSSPRVGSPRSASASVTGGPR